MNLREDPWDYQVGKGEQGVLLIEPYKSEILPHWKFRTPKIALVSAKKIYRMFLCYRDEDDFVGMDMARKFLQMGYTRSRRYANHRSGRKFDHGKLLPRDEDEEKARSAEIFYGFWKKTERDPKYRRMRAQWKEWFG